ncbi:hypothetical protein BC826DRAFT_321074 [Russula brevipes]|nr:hypothetical protein BC826DRAFT_1077923 [Russula brevipes]KAI0281882.1 hypothetical protein BC826DRAFT_321074 [Russula brevipes]
MTPQPQLGQRKRSELPLRQTPLASRRGHSRTRRRGGQAYARATSSHTHHAVYDARVSSQYVPPGGGDPFATIAALADDAPMPPASTPSTATVTCPLVAQDPPVRAGCPCHPRGPVEWGTTTTPLRTIVAACPHLRSRLFHRLPPLLHHRSVHAAHSSAWPVAHTCPAHCAVLG